MKSLFYSGVFMALFLMTAMVGCKKDDLSKMSGNPIQFGQLAVGQKSTYIKYTGESISDPANGNYQLDSMLVNGGYDSLRWEVIGIHADTFVILETWYNEYSMAPLWPVDSTLINAWVDSTTGNLHLMSAGQSWLIHRGPFHLELPLSGVTTPATVTGWKTTFWDGNFWLGDVTLNGTPYYDVMAQVDNSAMVVDGPGFTVMYNADAGIINSYRLGEWATTDRGWFLVQMNY